MSELRIRIDWKRYLGEITVIVIGVLIAFAVDNWRISRIDRALEREYLYRLVADLQSNAEIFRGFIDRLKRKENALNEIAPFVRGKVIDIPDKEHFLHSVSLGGILGLWPSGFIVIVTYDDLVSTGNMRLLRNTHLRANVAAYYANAKVAVSRTMLRDTGYALFVHKLLPGELLDSMNLIAMEKFGVDRALERIRSPEFEDLLNQEMNYMYFLRGMLEPITTDTQELLDMLETELEK